MTLHHSLAANPARIHLLPALGVPVVVVLRRKPSKVFHLMKWRTDTNELEHGSWYRGKLNPLYCDVSRNGKHLVHFAVRANGKAYSGVSEVPSMTPFVEAAHTFGDCGGGVFSKSGKTLHCLDWLPPADTVPFVPQELSHRQALPVLCARLQRDGWKRLQEWPIRWECRPVENLPALRLHGDYIENEYRHEFRFELEGHANLLEGASWALYDCRNQLVYGQHGRLNLWGADDLARGTPRAVHDLENLTPPWRRDAEPQED